MARALAVQAQSLQRSELPFFPDFFIVGAPRCGTTAMSHYLGHHPQVCFSRPKEPHFFSLVRKLQPHLQVEDYLTHCFHHYAPEHHNVLGEGSVSYLYDSEAIDEILRLNPEAKFIVMVRNPMELVYSYHARLVALLDEDEEDFESAWQLQPKRAKGKRVPKSCRNPFLLQYAEIGKLGKYLDQFLQRVDRDRCLVLVFDDFINDPLTTYRRVLAFIGVEYDGRSDFPPRESNKYARFRWLQRWLKRPPVKVASFLATLEHQRRRKKHRKHSSVKRIRKWLLNKNLVHKPRQPLPMAMRREMLQTFREDIDRLAQLIGRDLSHWKRL